MAQLLLTERHSSCKWIQSCRSKIPVCRFPSKPVILNFSDYYEWWYTYLKPNLHYIPVEKDLSNLFEQIEWAKSNDQKAKQIALNANALVAQWMTPEIMYCYYVRAFEKYR